MLDKFIRFVVEKYFLTDELKAETAISNHSQAVALIIDAIERLYTKCEIEEVFLAEKNVVKNFIAVMYFITPFGVKMTEIYKGKKYKKMYVDKASISELISKLFAMGISIKQIRRICSKID